MRVVTMRPILAWAGQVDGSAALSEAFIFFHFLATKIVDTTFLFNAFKREPGRMADMKRLLGFGLAALLFFSWAAAEKFYSEVWYEVASGPLPGFAGIYYDYKTKVYVVRMVPRKDNGLLKYVRGKADRVGARLEVPEALLMRVVRLIEDAGGFSRPNPRFRMEVARYSFKQLTDWEMAFIERFGGYVEVLLNVIANKIEITLPEESKSSVIVQEVKQTMRELGVPPDAYYLIFGSIPEQLPLKYKESR